MEPKSRALSENRQPARAELLKARLKESDGKLKKTAKTFLMCVGGVKPVFSRPHINRFVS